MNVGSLPICPKAVERGQSSRRIHTAKVAPQAFGFGGAINSAGWVREIYIELLREEVGDRAIGEIENISAAQPEQIGYQFEIKRSKI